MSWLSEQFYCSHVRLAEDKAHERTSWADKRMQPGTRGTSREPHRPPSIGTLQPSKLLRTKCDRDVGARRLVAKTLVTYGGPFAGNVKRAPKGKTQCLFFEVLCEGRSAFWRPLLVKMGLNQYALAQRTSFKGRAFIYALRGPSAQSPGWVVIFAPRSL